MEKSAKLELQNEESSYLSRKRTYGEGETWVGLNFDLNDDIYSVGFIS